MAARKRPEQRATLTIHEANPAAPTCLLIGSLYVYLPCEMCQESVWSFAANVRCVCNACCPPEVAEGTEGGQPVYPLRKKGIGGGD